MEHISRYQLFCLAVLFVFGSTTLFALGINAKQDAWLVILFSMFIGFVLLWVYSELYKKFPGKNIAEIINILLGKFIGIPLVFLYGTHFLYGAVRNLRDFGELINMTFLPETPMFVIEIIFMITVFYILFLGLEVLARTAEIMMPVLLSFVVSIFVLITFSQGLNFQELLPVLGNGIKPVLAEAYPIEIVFPFGEQVVLFMFWPYINDKKGIRKPMFFALLLSGILLTITLIITITVLGVDYAAAATVPFLEIVKLINIGDIITNIDAFGIVLMFIGGFYKTIIHFVGGVLIFKTLFKLKDIRSLIIPLGLFVFLISIIIATSYPYFVKTGLGFTVRYEYVIYTIIIPVLLLIIYWLKKGTKSKIFLNMIRRLLLICKLILK